MWNWQNAVRALVNHYRLNCSSQRFISAGLCWTLVARNSSVSVFIWRIISGSIHLLCIVKVNMLIDFQSRLFAESWEVVSFLWMPKPSFLRSVSMMRYT
jgi:hypothetical protein